MIIRSPRPTSHFSTFSNAIIRDQRLSYRARGILLDILSRPDNWTVTADSLAKSGKEGRAAILAALTELRVAGYMVTTKRQKENGQFETSSVVFDESAGHTEVQEPNLGKPKSENRTSKEELIKNDLKEKNSLSLVSLGLEEPLILANLLADRIEANGSKRPNVTQAWVKDMDKLMRLDGRTPLQVRLAIEWCQADSFWSTNILSPAKLRQKYDQLRLKASQENVKRQPKGLKAIMEVMAEEQGKAQYAIQN